MMMVVIIIIVIRLSFNNVRRQQSNAWPVDSKNVCYNSQSHCLYFVPLNTFSFREVSTFHQTLIGVHGKNKVESP